MSDQNPAETSRSSPTSLRLLAAAGVAAMTAGSVLIAAFDPAKSNFLPACPILSLTGFACPGCGLTRGFHSLFHGDVIPAIDFNALIPFWVVIFGYSFISLLLLALRGRGLPMWMARPGFLAAVLVVLLGFGVVRNIPVYPFTILFP